MLQRRLRLGPWRTRSTCRSISLCLAAVILVSIWLVPRTVLQGPRASVGRLTEEHVQRGQGVGGRWYIPPSWLQQSHTTRPQHLLDANSSILDAAKSAFELALHHHAFLNNSHIPLMTHQIWHTLETETWNHIIRESVEEWIRAAVGDGNSNDPQMAWFLWDFDGIDALIKEYETQLYEDFQRLPYLVEKADVFRVVVLKWFGGVYADVDAQPIKHPYNWIFDSDLTPWIDTSSHAEYTLHIPPTQAYILPSDAPISYSALYSSVDFSTLSEPSVNAIFGIGADNLPEPNPTYWRMGYTYPIQITNWALSMAPHHPVANQFIHSLRETILVNRNHLLAVDPLDITGPPALTAAVQNVAQNATPELSWDALSGRNGDPIGGRGKLVAGDALILPITGFNPGRGWFHNMGSQSITHPSARLRHAAMGSWKKIDLKVHYGKLCRILFGMCKDWTKIPVT